MKRSSKDLKKNKKKRDEESEEEEEEDDEEENQEDEDNDGEDGEDEDGAGDDEEEEGDWKELIEEFGKEPNKKMLAWAEVLGDEEKLQEVVKQVWKKHFPEDKELDDDEAEKIPELLKEANEEVQKLVLEKVPDADPEETEEFPFSGEDGNNLEEFLETASISEFDDTVKMLKLLGGKLWPAIYKVFEKKYQNKQVPKNEVEETYEKFFRDVGLEVKEEICDELFSIVKSKDAKVKNFGMGGVIKMVKYALEDRYYAEKGALHRSSMFNDYTWEY